MWLLPRTLPSIALAPGVYFLPAHLDPRDVRDTVEIVARMLSDQVDFIVEVPQASLGRLMLEGSRAAALVMISEQIEDVDAKLASLGAKYVFAQLPPAQDKGFGWLQRTVKPALFSSLQRLLRDPSHPLARQGLADLPLLSASALTGEPLELLQLVESTMQRRMESAVPVSPSEALAAIAAEGFLAKLAPLDREGRRAALEVVLAGGEGDQNDASYRRGAEALAGVGLAMVLEGDVALGPLARAVTSEEEINTIVKWLAPREAWSKRAAQRELARAERSTAELTAPVDVLLLTALGSRPPERRFHVRHEVTVTTARLPQIAGIASLPFALDLVRAHRPSLVVLGGMCAATEPALVGQVIVATNVGSFAHEQLSGPPPTMNRSPARRVLMGDRLPVAADLSATPDADRAFLAAALGSSPFVDVVEALAPIPVIGLFHVVDLVDGKREVDVASSERALENATLEIVQELANQGVLVHGRHL